MKRVDPRLLYLAAAMAVNTFGFSLVLPFLSVYLHSEQGVPMEVVGTIYAVAGLAGAFGMLAGGELADRRGPREVMTTTLLARAANLGLLGLLLWLDSWLWLIAALVVVNAFLRSIFTPACNVAAAAVGGKDDQMRAFGWQRIGINAGWALGPVVGGLLADVNYGAMFLCAVPLTLGSVWLAAQVRVEAPPRRERFRPRDLLPSPAERRLWPFFMGAVLLYALTTQLVTTIPVFAHEVRGLPKREIGAVFMINGLAVVALQALGTRLASRLGVRIAILGGTTLYVTGYLLLGLLPGLAGIATAIIVVTCGEVLCGPAVLTAAAGLMPGDRTGRVMGWLGLSNAAGLSLGAGVGGIVLGALEPYPMAVWAALAMFGAASAVFFAVSLRRRGPSPSPAHPAQAAANAEGAPPPVPPTKVVPPGASVDGKREAR